MCIISSLKVSFFFNILVSQETALCFIEHLSNVYSSYVDVVQPVQVAIYEMKFGLSLIISSLLYKKYLEEIGEQDMEMVLVNKRSIFLLFIFIFPLAVCT